MLVLALASSFAYAGETTNKIGITMVDIPAGSFLMGSCKPPANCSNADPDAYDVEIPQHRVNVRAFQMGKTEVTLGQFKKFIAAAGRTELLSGDFMKYNAYGDNTPVVEVSWHDAQDFIKWLNSVDGGGYRLPSEAEWEYACRAGGQHKYCGGNDLNALGWYDDNSGKRPRPVGGKQANAFGLHDMSGNVYEWVQDCQNHSYRGAPTDGSAWTSGECDARVLRGGSWFNVAKVARAANRSIFYLAGSRNFINGFRLARTR
ncbi:MAG: formylglycine-generating enzyme family protein [Azonexus sp.]|nr:formylglycine-generating enzyme family protein [Azonexus sp.]